ncbi:hypothetical protein [Streptomyces sp. SID13031]|uniref:hypothetical protein n=1 Tax=Streptomyces sp. SID13031 TaxID=2706046 RepID=UPI0013CD8719|nr:hypothetical protein [Streptomyces sp. SID13031]NEA30264.1 hypothetical protein [Streptomyces sp. SID13031]
MTWSNWTGDQHCAPERRHAGRHLGSAGVLEVDQRSGLAPWRTRATSPNLSARVVGMRLVTASGEVAELAVVERRKLPILLPFEVRFTASDDAYLSTAYQR